MLRSAMAVVLLCASVCAQPVWPAAPKDDDSGSSSQSVNAVIEWNRTLLKIVRTPGAQPATIHSTRNFAILHLAIFDEGIWVGQTVAGKILAVRANDGSQIVPPPYVPGNQPGDYQLTLPNLAQPDFRQWPQVTRE